MPPRSTSGRCVTHSIGTVTASGQYCACSTETIVRPTASECDTLRRFARGIPAAPWWRSRSSPIRRMRPSVLVCVREALPGTGRGARIQPEGGRRRVVPVCDWSESRATEGDLRSNASCPDVLSEAELATGGGSGTRTPWTIDRWSSAWVDCGGSLPASPDCRLSIAAVDRGARSVVRALNARRGLVSPGRGR